MIVGMTRRQFVATVFATAFSLSILAFGGYQFWKWRQPLWLVAELKGHSAGVTWVAFTPDGNKVLSASHDKTIRVWDWRKGRCERILEGHEDSIRCLALMGNNRVASASWDGTVRIWNWRTGKQLAKFTTKVGRLNALTVSPNGKWLVAGGEQGIFAKSENRKANRILPTTNVRSLAFHPNGQVLAIGDGIGTNLAFEFGSIGIGGKMASTSKCCDGISLSPQRLSFVLRKRRCDSVGLGCY